jgi:hypothetical protein
MSVYLLIWTVAAVAFRDPEKRLFHMLTAA